MELLYSVVKSGVLARVGVLLMLAGLHEFWPLQHHEVTSVV
jgi:hypothetical protein